MLTITATQDTWLKKLRNGKALQARQLEDNEKNFVPQGKSWPVDEILPDKIDGHIGVILAYGSGTRYVWPEHFSGLETKSESTSGFYTKANLKQIMPTAKDSDITIYVEPLNRVAAKFSINTKLRSAAFIAQLAHESGSLRYKEEIASGSAYEGRKDLGNIQPGDGRRFKGRGLIQLTGRANYTQASKELGIDLISDPTKIVSDPYLNCLVAGWYWNSRNINKPADVGDFVRVTKLVNGGTNGLADRQQYYVKAKQYLAGQALIKTTGESSFVERIVSYCENKGYKLSKDEGHFNIVYVEGVNLDGSLNDDRPNEWNDARLLIRFFNGKPSIVKAWEATTEPGSHYTYNTMNSKGAARIAFGYYKAWKVGSHNGNHEALVQTGGLVTVHRDFNKDFKRTGDKLDSGYFGINQHNGYDYPKNNIGKGSAGCLVGRTRAGHREFMSVIKQDPRYKANRGYVFDTIILPGDEL